MAARPPAPTAGGDQPVSTDKPRGFWRGVGAGLAILGIGALGSAIAVIGFAVSFDTLTRIAEPVVPGDIPGTPIPWAATLPAVVDAVVVFLSAMRIVKASRGKRSPIIEVLEYSLIGVTVVLNATVGDTLRDRIVHAAFPAAYVIVTAVGTVVILDRFETIRARAARDRIAVARWLLAPLDTVSLWRSMKIAGTGSFAVAIRLERHKIAQYQTWRTNRGSWWWLPTGVSRAERKALRLELAEIAIDASRVPAGDTPVVPSLPVETPSPVPSRDTPAVVPAPVPAVPVAPSRPRPATLDRDVPAQPVLVPGETTRIGDLDLTALYTPDQLTDRVTDAVRAFVDPAMTSPYRSQAAIATAFGMSTSQVSRIKQRVERELRLGRVNGSAVAHG